MTGIVLALALVCAPSDDAGSILLKVDAALNRAQDLFLTYDVVDQPAGKAERTLGIEVYVKGDKRFTRFTAPGDVKGTKVLVLSDTQMYVYLPAYKKVRRIASHVTAQGFMGTTYSNDDMALVRFANKYVAEIIRQDDASWVLALKSKSGAEAPYPKIVLTIDKSRTVPTKLEYYGDSGLHLKTEVREGYECRSDFCNAAVMKMVDHSDNEHWTKLVRKDWKVNSGLPETVFSKRNLARE